VIKLHGPATTKLLRGEAVEVIDGNPRRIQAASAKAQRGNYDRRDPVARGMSPGLLLA
jgi:hypothetical protein